MVEILSRTGWLMLPDYLEIKHILAFTTLVRNTTVSKDR